jgi:O-antigen/teichoic acid export membrane protein
MRRNVVANYATQFYVMGIGIVMAPIYLSFMGKEAYGLIGFFTMMAAVFQFLDLGLTPTLARETARFRGGAISVDTLRVFLRALEIVFGAASLAAAAAMILLADQISSQWLKVKDLPVSEVAAAVMLMGLAVPLRWVSGLYRGVVNGFERQVWLGGYNFVIATARFVGVLAVFFVLGATPVHFFTYQLVVALVELGGLMIMTYRLVRRGPGPREKFSWKPLLGNLTFSLSIAFTATAWVVISQTDKLVLSEVLPLAEFGVFSIAVVAAGAINALGAPLGQALLPRLTRLVAEKNEDEAAKLYGDGTQALLVMVAPAVAALAFFAEPILLAWTGKPEVARHAAPILRLYAIGNGWIALCSFPYYLQYAKGDLRLHFIGNAAMLVLLVPAIVVGARHYGALGTGVAWMTMTGSYALGWVPAIHARIFRGRHWRWMLRDVVPIVVPTALAAWILMLMVSWPNGRLGMIAVAVGVGAVLLLVAGIGSSLVRSRVVAHLSSRLARITGGRP